MRMCVGQRFRKKAPEVTRLGTRTSQSKGNSADGGKGRKAA